MGASIDLALEVLRVAGPLVDSPDPNVAGVASVTVAGALREIQRFFPPQGTENHPSLSAVVAEEGN